MYGQPAYGAPMMAPAPMYAPPPQQAAGPTIITVGGGNDNSGSGSPCPTCCKDTGNMPRKKVGCVAILWCVACFLLTGSVCALYPLCSDSCKDTELVCVRCQTVKSKIEANCCWFHLIYIDFILVFFSMIFSWQKKLIECFQHSHKPKNSLLKNLFRTWESFIEKWSKLLYYLFLTLIFHFIKKMYGQQPQYY